MREKLAHYYNIGVELALTKQAGLPKEVIRSLMQVAGGSAGAVTGAYGGLSSLGKGMSHTPETTADIITLLAATGLGGTMGSSAASKSVDLAHSGGAKLLKKLKS